MNEVEWNTTEDAEAMLRFVRPVSQPERRLASDRKLNLFADAAGCAECRRLTADFTPGERALYVAGASCGWRRDKAAILRDLVNPFRPVALPKPEKYRVMCKCGGAFSPLKKDTLPLLSICERCHSDGPFWADTIKETPPCPWLTPLVVSLAESAYAERPGRRCGRCGGSGRIDPPCDTCEGTGRVADPDSEFIDGAMDCPDCDSEDCPDCHGTGHTNDGTLDPARLQVLADALEEEGCDNADLLAHLRSPGPHWRGCWAVDLILGKG